MQEGQSPPTTTAQLPRGYVAWPKYVLDALQAEQQRKGMKFADDYVQCHLERATLRYYYAEMHVAYRPVAGGIEVLAVGWPEVDRYLEDASVKVVQA
ncbi:MAG TPA: hypothetical protein VFW33_04410 [Gemmataceae bacterium]|nr:hypothetical protein [Gemmataceae bacterium]